MPAVETCMHYILYIVIVNIDYCDIFLPDKTAPFLDFLYHLIHDNLFCLCHVFWSTWARTDLTRSAWKLKSMYNADERGIIPLFYLFFMHGFYRKLFYRSLCIYCKIFQKPLHMQVLFEIVYNYMKILCLNAIAKQA